MRVLPTIVPSLVRARGPLSSEITHQSSCVSCQQRRFSPRWWPLLSLFVFFSFFFFCLSFALASPLHGPWIRAINMSCCSTFPILEVAIGTECTAAGMGSWLPTRLPSRRPAVKSREEAVRRKKKKARSFLLQGRSMADAPLLVRHSVFIRLTSQPIGGPLLSEMGKPGLILETASPILGSD